MPLGQSHRIMNLQASEVGAAQYWLLKLPFYVETHGVLRKRSSGVSDRWHGSQIKRQRQCDKKLNSAGLVETHCKAAYAIVISYRLDSLCN